MQYNKAAGFRKRRLSGILVWQNNDEQSMMNIAVDIGNTCIKCGIFFSNETRKVTSNPLPKEDQIGEEFVQDLMQWRALSEKERLAPLSWRIARTGSFPWEKVQAEILKTRPQDRFITITHRHIPLKMDVDAPEKVGIDRLLAAYSALDLFGDVPLLIVDAGTAITVDVVQKRTFCGGVILPGLSAKARIYPQMSEKLPLIEYSYDFIMKQGSPGKNTEDAIQNGCYWGTIGAIRLFYEMLFPRMRKVKVQLVVAGGDGGFLVPGLTRVLETDRIRYYPNLVLEGIGTLPGLEEPLYYTGNG